MTVRPRRTRARTPARPFGPPPPPPPPPSRSILPLSPPAFQPLPPSCRALFLYERIHFARFPFSRTDCARVCVCACDRAARRMAARGYRCTSNYDQRVLSDLTTLFSPVHAPTPNEKCSRPMRPRAARGNPN